MGTKTTRKIPSVQRPAANGYKDDAFTKPPAIIITVRSSQDQLSSLLDQAAQGDEVIITSEGRLKAGLTAVRVRRKPFPMDWDSEAAESVRR